MATPIAGIEILGPGCARCHETHRVVRRVVEQAKRAVPAARGARLPPGEAVMGSRSRRDLK